ncbi:unnamed protein product [Fusarium venenatum]|uniref:Uncharacterized protein n=1 Tax=Fusarium venenatum TaxID=56646 RepID=A0A2L2TAA6_9HYPO|nr:uncharacterized protein FVRRES_07951 [Fusarium venenatum]CEI67874.1 unnamed protein product [Fusarium venenatum]
MELNLRSPKASQSTVFASDMLGSSQKNLVSSLTSPRQRCYLYYYYYYYYYYYTRPSGWQIVYDIVKELEKARDIKFKMPTKESGLIKGWQKDLLDGYAKSVEQNTTAKSFLEATVNGACLYKSSYDMRHTNNAEQSAAPGGSVDPDDQIAQIQAKTAQIGAVLEPAEHCLHCPDSDLFQGSIKGIFVQCISLVVKLRNEITNLIRFVKAISAIVQFITSKHVNPSIETMKRSSCFNSTIIIRSYYSIFANITSMWTKVSQTRIFPGLRMVDGIPALDPSGDGLVQASHRGDLKEGKRSKLMEGMESRVTQIGQKTGLLLPPAPKVIKAIESGAKTRQQASQQEI